MASLNKDKGLLWDNFHYNAITLAENTSALKPRTTNHEIHEKLLPAHLVGAYQKEVTMLQELISQPSFKKITIEVSEATDIVSIKDYQDNLKILHDFMSQKGINPAIMEYLFVGHDEHAYIASGNPDMVVKMKPNSLCPMISVASLKLMEPSLIEEKYSRVASSHQELMAEYQEKLSQLKNCKDPEFVKQQKADLGKELKAFERLNKSALNQITSNKQTFTTYLEDIGVKALYDSIELVAPVKKSKKRI